MDYGWVVRKRFEGGEKWRWEKVNIEKNEYLIEGRERREEDVCRRIERGEGGGDLGGSKGVGGGEDGGGEVGDGGG